MNTINQTMLICRGLPGSGKTTFSLHLTKEDYKFKRISRDDIRNSIGGSYSNESEKLVKLIFLGQIKTILTAGYSVIIDATNLDHKTIEAYLTIRDDVNPKIRVEIKTFHYSYDDILKRNSSQHRINAGTVVPAIAMENFWRKYISHPHFVLSDFIENWKEKAPTFEKVKQIPTLQRAVIFDIDGTLALNEGYRTWYEYSKVIDDKLSEEVHNAYKFYKKEGYVIIICSGREDDGRSETIKWLEKHDINFDLLLMRESKDYRKDSIVKHEIYMNHIHNTYYVEVVYDDRNQVVDMWRELGLKCFQVAQGDY